MTETIRELLNAGVGALAAFDSARLDAELLMGMVLTCDRAHLIRDVDAPVVPAAAQRYRALLAARAAGRPLAQLRGWQEFWSLRFEVDTNVLIPRSETELLVSLVLDKISHRVGAVIADLGTGSGAVAIAIAKERADTTVLAVERSPRALAVAQRNARQHRVTNVHFSLVSWAEALRPTAFDVIVSNPPYVACDDPLLTESALRYEPREALAAGSQGLDALAIIAKTAPPALVRGGCLLLEHGASHGADVRALLVDAGLASITTVHDLAGHERITCGYRAENLDG